MDAVHRKVYGSPAPGMVIREAWQVDPDRVREVVSMQLRERLGIIEDLQIDAVRWNGHRPHGGRGA
jgi:hypothetical protein